MNIGLGDPKPSFPLLAGTGVRRAFGHAGSNPAAHKGRFMMLSKAQSSYMLSTDLSSYNQLRSQRRAGLSPEETGNKRPVSFFVVRQLAFAL